MTPERKRSRNDNDADGRRSSRDYYVEDLRRLIQQKQVVILVGAGLSRNVCDSRLLG
jgi:hypothetical protein